MIDANRGNIYLLSFIFLQFHQKKKHNAPGSGFKWQKMIQAQFISSWWHWLQVFNWKGGNEDPNRKVVLRENKWHYVVILLKRNKTKTSLNTWGFQQKKEGTWKAQCLNFCVLWAGGLRQQKDALTISNSISLSKILVQKKNFDNTLWCVQMYRSANDFFYER